MLLVKFNAQPQRVFHSHGVYKGVTLLVNYKT